MSEPVPHAEYQEWVEQLDAETRGTETDEHAERVGRVILTRASDIKVRRVRWLWDQRIAYGTLALLAGREGLGKSTLAYQIGADITRGTLDGEDKGNPRAVIVCASEDSWEHTIVPRLIAAGADLDLVYKVEIQRGDYATALSLPKDFLEVAYVAEHTGAGLMILDPLMSAIDTRLDTHKDRELRAALEPLAKLADTHNMAILGLIHHNKSGSTDPLQLVMGSKAFTAVARSVSTVIPDPDDEDEVRRLFGTPKNNLGRDNLPMLGFTMTGHAVETEDDGTNWTARINWTGEVAGSVREVMSRSGDQDGGITNEAADWLRDHLLGKGGEDDAQSIRRAGAAAGHVWRTLQRARQRAKVKHYSSGFPRRTWWYLPEHVDRSDRADAPAAHGADRADDERPVDVTEPRHLTDLNEPAEPAEARPTPVENYRPSRLMSQSLGRNPEGAKTPAPQSRQGLAPLGATAETAQSRHQSRQGAGATGVADNSVAPSDPDHTQSRQSRQGLAPLGATGSDLRKRETGLAYARTRDTSIVGATESWRHCEADSVAGKSPVAPVAPGAPHVRTREGHPDPPPFPTPKPDLHVPAPTCPDCCYPIDHPEHDRTCEETP